MIGVLWVPLEAEACHTLLFANVCTGLDHRVCMSLWLVTGCEGGTGGFSGANVGGLMSSADVLLVGLVGGSVVQGETCCTVS